MRVILSGLDELGSRALVGEFLWRGKEIEWMESGRCVELIRARRLDSKSLIVWFYRSPVSEVRVAARVGDDIQKALFRWHCLNSAVLQLSGRDRDIRLINVDSIVPGQFPIEAFASDGVPKSRGEQQAPCGGSDAYSSLVFHLIGLAAPNCVQLLEALSGVTWNKGSLSAHAGAYSESSQTDPFAMLEAVLASDARSRRELEDVIERLRFELFEMNSELSAVLAENELLVVQHRHLQDAVRGKLG